MVSSAKIRLKIVAEKRSLPMQYCTVFINNIPITSSAERILGGAEQDNFVREVETPLFHHENKIRVEVSNGTSMGLSETYIYKAGKASTMAKGNLYLLSVGVNDFKNMPNLDYAALHEDCYITTYVSMDNNFAFNHASASSSVR